MLVKYLFEGVVAVSLKYLSNALGRLLAGIKLTGDNCLHKVDAWVADCCFF